jgi:hypothetical protein
MVEGLHANGGKCVRKTKNLWGRKVFSNAKKKPCNALGIGKRLPYTWMRCGNKVSKKL